ncbi:MAG TPA: ribosome maturation factor RimP [Nitrospiria bacterium]|nr:ribosome maturation factor RimP [Nitrospiria bacterium]
MILTAEEKVRGIAKPIVDSLGYELIDVEYLAGGNRAKLRLFIDKEGGVTLDDCEKTSRYVGYALDVEDPMSTSYVLEVSSPGLDRPLKKPSDYERYKGRLVKIKTKVPVNDQMLFIGRLSGIINEKVEIKLDGERSLSISLDDISLARLEVEF